MDDEVIENCVNEHARIFIDLKRVIVYGIETHEGQRTLFSLRHSLIKHLQNENEFIYPYLLDKSKSDDLIRKKLTDFEKDLQKSTDFVNYFFETYGMGSNGSQFIHDFRELFSIISQRIRIEESILLNI